MHCCYCEVSQMIRNSKNIMVEAVSDWLEWLQPQGYRGQSRDLACMAPECVALTQHHARSPSTFTKQTLPQRLGIVVGWLSMWIPLCRSAHMRSTDYMKPAECEMHFCYRSYFLKSNFEASWCKDAVERQDGFYSTPVSAEPLKYQKMEGLI